MLINPPLPTPPPGRRIPQRAAQGGREPGARISAPGKWGKSLDQKFAWPRPPLPMRPPRPCESFPGPRAQDRARTGAQLGPEPGAGSTPGRAGRQCLRLLFKVTVGGCGRGRRWPRRGSHLPPKFARAIRAQLPPRSRRLPVPPLTASRPRHRHGYLIRAYFLIETGPEGTGRRPRREGEGEGRGPRQESKLTLPPPVAGAPPATPPRPRARRAPTPPQPRRAPRPPHLCFPYLIYIETRAWGANSARKRSVVKIVFNE